MPTPQEVIQAHKAWRDGFIYGVAAGMTLAGLVVIVVCWFSGIHLCR
jgi:hypothetical protein